MVAFIEMLMPTIAINGRVAGTRKRTFRKDAVVITSKPVAPLTNRLK